ncbi:Ig-like domain-containing protein [Portibacter marinus]|uniref:Ig-like domain-containing protein n=1 Tax=Portibacter marinus TaxID=2898660 RepID=UPI001F357ADF|nr:Ig-like domain-containing protein [Portibacter marinus]
MIGHLAISGQQIIDIADDVVSCQCEPNLTDLFIYQGSSPSDGLEVIGNYKRDSSTITFKPLIPFMKNGFYTAVCGEAVKTWSVSFPDDYIIGEVQAIYPSTSDIPSNILKFNVHFSKPMMEIAYEWISIIDEKGEEVERAILDEIPELWNEDRTQLSLWIEPGRTKRGLGPNEKLGPVFQPGQNYILRVSGEIRDREGIKLATNYDKEFKVITADRQSPDFEKWSVESTKVNGKVGLKIIFDEVMDVASTLDAFSVQGIKGFWSIQDGERAILFEPEVSLSPGQYKIEVNPLIEDIAGNNLERPFDRDLTQNLETRGSFVLTLVVH